MEKGTLQDILLLEEEYCNQMETVVKPYLSARMTTEYCEREPGKKIFYARCLSDQPKGVVILSHGYTETIEKHLENIYYFLKNGYHVFMPEHCGHGRSYRMCRNVEDLSLVHVDDYRRYIEDLLFVSHMAKKAYPNFPLCLYGHSMGGGIAGAAAAKEPELFFKIVLSSPMIRPSSKPVPWGLACLIAKTLCTLGKSEAYIMGQHPYDGLEAFKDSASVSEARFHYYQKIRQNQPYFQMNGASYGWLLQTAGLNRHLMKKAWKNITCSVLVFQAEQETFVSNKEQVRFVKKINRQKKSGAKLVLVPGVKHEIFNAGAEVLEHYWFKILNFFSLYSESAKSMEETPENL